MCLIEVKNLVKEYFLGGVTVRALRGVDLRVASGEFIAIMGESGSGKSTLMNLIGCLDQPTSGEYLIEGLPVNRLGKNELSAIRNEKMGFVFQGFNLLPRSSALENVELPLIYDRSGSGAACGQAAIAALQKVGLQDRMRHVPSQMSGGQQQRVAIARALVNNPAIILADEPTGNLDSRTSQDIMHLFCQLNSSGITMIIVTHSREVAEHTRRILFMRDGLIYKEELPRGAPREAGP